MGQYYHPTNFNKMESLYSHDSGNGLKLMEHSYIGNGLVNAVERLLLGPWAGDQIVWAGDYAGFEDEPVREDATANLYDSAVNIPYTHLVEDTNVRYFVNLKKMEYVDKKDVKLMSYGLRIHPLPLLTASSNGRGGGDYRSDAGIKFVGSWSGHPIVALEDSEEATRRLKQGAYTKIDPKFSED